jgi:hypothetical protein
MFKALYAVSRIPEWKDVSLRLSEKFSIQPVYWICSSAFRNDIESTYRGIIYHETVDANRGIFPEGVMVKNFLWKNTILEYAELEREFYVLLNRHDIDGSFSYEDRKRLYYSQLNYWLNVIHNMKIDVLVLSETPHAISHFVLYTICKKLNIRTLMLSLTTLPGTLYVKESFSDVPIIPVNKKDTEKLNQVMSVNINKILNTNESPWYMIKQRKLFVRAGLTIRLQALLSLFPFLLEKVRILPRKPYNEFYKKRGKTFEESDYTRSEFALKRMELRKRQYRLRQSYRALCETPDLNKPYLYFPLHFQPERSSCPEGSVYADQQLVIQMIADKLPDDTYLYVKEHPSQFLMTRGALGRTQYFYEDVKKLPRVALVDDTFSSRRLIENSLSVVTLTGTAGMEALFCARPALVFGYAWYRKIPGVFYIEDPQELESALARIKSGFTVDTDTVLNYLEQYKSCFFAGYVTRWSMNSVSISYEENVNALYQGIASILLYLGYKENLK